MLTHKKIVYNQNKMESTEDQGKADYNNNTRVSECSSTFQKFVPN